MILKMAHHQVITNKWPELVQRIKHSADTIADNCRAKGLISEETSAKITDITKNSDKARLLLNNVLTTIRAKPHLFEAFMGILEEDISHEDLVKSLRTGFEKTPIEESGLKDTALVKPEPGNGFTDSAFLNMLQNLHFANLDRKGREAEIRDLKKKIEDTNKENAELKKENDSYAQTLRKLVSIHADNNKKLEEKTQQLAEMEKKRNKAVKKRKEVEKSLQNQSEEISQLERENERMHQDLIKMESLQQEVKANSRELDQLTAIYEQQRQRLLEIEEEVCKEQRGNQRCRYGFTVILVVVVLFAAMLGYCLEDEENHNMKQCMQTMLNSGMDKLSWK